MPHDFAIKVLDLNTGSIEPGEIATATFTVPEGANEFACTYHSGMTGRIDARWPEDWHRRDSHRGRLNPSKGSLYE